MNQLSLKLFPILVGLRYLLHPNLRSYTLIPIAVNVVVFVILFFVAKHCYQLGIDWTNHYLPHWLLWLDHFLWLAFIATFFLFFSLCFAVIANLIASPFNSLLAEKVQQILLHSTPKSAEMHLGHAIADLPRIFGRSVKQLFYFIPRILLCGLLLLVPIINMFVPFIWFITNGWMLGIQYMDFPMDNNRLTHLQLLQWCRQHRLQVLALGINVHVLYLIPIINLITMPAAVISATLLSEKIIVSKNEEQKMAERLNSLK